MKDSDEKGRNIKNNKCIPHKNSITKKKIS